jgi:hypothetical protein
MKDRRHWLITSKNNHCKIWYFHGCDYEECRLLGCGPVWILCVSTFRRNVSLPSSGQKNPRGRYQLEQVASDWVTSRKTPNYIRTGKELWSPVSIRSCLYKTIDILMQFRVPEEVNTVSRPTLWNATCLTDDHHGENAAEAWSYCGYTPITVAAR